MREVNVAACWVEIGSCDGPEVSIVSVLALFSFGEGEGRGEGR